MTETPEVTDPEMEPRRLAANPPTEGLPAPQAASSARPASRGAQPASARELEPIPYPDVAPPGAIREALGALLAARAEPGEFPAASPAEDPAAGPAESQPAPSAPASSSAPPVVRKETERESSGSESLLVETPSF